MNKQEVENKYKKPPMNPEEVDRVAASLLKDCMHGSIPLGTVMAMAARIVELKIQLQAAYNIKPMSEAKETVEARLIWESEWKEWCIGSYTDKWLEDGTGITLNKPTFWTELPPEPKEIK